MTAVEWLENELNNRCDITGNGDSIIDIFQQAKEMEANQIMIAYEYGSMDGANSMIYEKEEYTNSDDYYNKNYKSCNN